MKKIAILFYLAVSVTNLLAQNCASQITYHAAPDCKIQLTVVDSFGLAITNAVWSTGETSATIQIAQAGEYCVNTTNASGCAATTCANIWTLPYVEIVTGLNANNQPVLYSSVYSTFPVAYSWTYTWNTGHIGPEQPVIGEGFYCVTVTSTNGCLLDTCKYYAPSDSTPGCSVWVGETSEGVLSASASGGISPFSYHWNNGSFGQNIIPSNNGNYCVTMTDAIGCTTAGCFWYYDSSTCEVNISPYQLNADSILLYANVPDLPVDYQWSTGETSNFITVGAPGEYCVTVVNSNGCTVADCFSVGYVDSLLIEVFTAPDSLDLPVFAEIYVIRYDTVFGGVLTAMDTVLTDSLGKAVIGNLPEGTYLLKAALLPGSPYFSQFLPTYFHHKLLWNQAKPTPKIYLNPAPYFVPIILVPGQNPGGPGFIGGLVSQGANLTGGGGTDGFGEGDPFAGASVVLTLPNGTPVAVAVTNASGQYSFPNLPWGTYVLTLDIPGLGPVSITVTIGPDALPANNINFKVDDNSIALPAKEPVSGTPLKVFPNPAHDLLTVELPAAAELTLTNAQGQAVLRTQENGAIARLPLVDLPTGIYFLSARMANEIQVVKVMIE